MSNFMKKDLRLLYRQLKYYTNTIGYKTAPTQQYIRHQFLEYFIENNGHKFVRSSPVVPYCDPSVAFVNAGMNQVGFQK